jgi:predicted anti-sigma-YlaC factor YlaD
MMNCEQATQLLSIAMERKLNLKEQAELKVHLLICSGCRQFGQHVQQLRSIVRATKNSSDTPEEKK